MSKVAIELHPAAARTIAKNNPGCLAIQGDIQQINGVGNYRSQHEELVIFGGPPCQAFSTSNQRNRGPQNARNFLFREFLKFVQAEAPDWVVFENVPGILESGSRPYVLEIERKLRTLGFKAGFWGARRGRFRYTSASKAFLHRRFTQLDTKSSN